jgi:hypothetical protein
MQNHREEKSNGSQQGPLHILNFSPVDVAQSNSKALVKESADQRVVS